MVIHTERSISAVLPCNSHRKPSLRLPKRRDGTHHVDDVGVSQVYGQSKPADILKSYGCCFLKSGSGGLTIAVIYFHHKHSMR